MQPRKNSFVIKETQTVKGREKKNKNGKQISGEKTYLHIGNYSALFLNTSLHFDHTAYLPVFWLYS